MVGVPALRPETFSRSFPKLHRAQTRKAEAIKHRRGLPAISARGAPPRARRPHIVPHARGHGHLPRPSRAASPRHPPGKPYGKGRAPGPRGAALALKLLNFDRTRRSEVDACSDQFILHINTGLDGGALGQARAPRGAALLRGEGGRAGRPTMPLPIMLGTYLVSVVYDLSDRACQDERDDSASVRSFVGLGERDAPDETTLRGIRHLLGEGGLGEAMLAEVNAALAESGAAVSRGTIVDATFVEAPSSTKKREGARDPETCQGRKGNCWHFGYKAHIGVDADSGLVHTVEGTAANVSGVACAFALVRPGDEEAWVDSGYTGVVRRPEVSGDPALSRVVWHVVARRSKATEADRPFERALSSVRFRAGSPFHVLKDLFGMRKVRCRGARQGHAPDGRRLRPGQPPARPQGSQALCGPGVAPGAGPEEGTG